MDGAIWGVQLFSRAHVIRENASSIVGIPHQQVASEMNPSNADTAASVHGSARTLAGEALREAISRDRRERSKQFTPLSQLLGRDGSQHVAWDDDIAVADM